MEPMADAVPGEICRPAEISEVGDRAGEPAIDLVHLARMTLGDRRLEAEVLDLFARQADVLLTHMRDATPAAAAAFAHTLKGSACGIGAFGVTAAAEAIETEAKCGTGVSALALARLAAAVVSVKAAIADRRHHYGEE